MQQVNYTNDITINSKRKDILLPTYHKKKNIQRLFTKTKTTTRNLYISINTDFSNYTPPCYNFPLACPMSHEHKIKHAAHLTTPADI